MRPRRGGLAWRLDIAPGTFGLNLRCDGCRPHLLRKRRGPCLKWDFAGCRRRGGFLVTAPQFLRQALDLLTDFIQARAQDADVGDEKPHGGPKNQVKCPTGRTSQAGGNEESDDRQYKAHGWLHLSASVESACFFVRLARSPRSE